MASTWTTYHVHGPACVMVGTGSSDALEYLGMTEDGVEVDIQVMTKDKRSDASGEAPATRIARGSVASLRFRLASWQESVWAKVLRRSVAGATAGAAGAIGSIMDQAPGSANGKPWSFGIALPGTFDDPWFFPACLLDNGQNVKLSSEDTRNALQFKAIKPVNGDALTAALLGTFSSPSTVTADTVQLYQRTLPS